MQQVRSAGNWRSRTVPGLGFLGLYRDMTGILEGYIGFRVLGFRVFGFYDLERRVSEWLEQRGGAEDSATSFVAATDASRPCTTNGRTNSKANARESLRPLL